MAENDDNKPNPAEAFSNLLAKNNNDATALASRLFDENFDYREKLRKLKESLPKEGSVVLSEADAKEYAKFKKLKTDSNLEIKDILERVEKFPTLEADNRRLSNTETIYELSEVGIDGSKLKRSVLREQVFDKYPEAQITFKTEKDKDGNEAKVAYITTEGKEQSFSAFASEKLADYLPALKVNAEAQPPKPGNSPDPKPAGGAANFFDRYREKVKAQMDAKKSDPRSLEQAFGRTA